MKENTLVAIDSIVGNFSFLNLKLEYRVPLFIVSVYKGNQLDTMLLSACEAVTATALMSVVSSIM